MFVYTTYDIIPPMQLYIFFVRTEVLQYHVIPGALFTSGMHSGYVRTLDHGETLRITFQFFGKNYFKTFFALYFIAIVN